MTDDGDKRGWSWRSRNNGPSRTVAAAGLILAASVIVITVALTIFGEILYGGRGVEPNPGAPSPGGPRPDGCIIYDDFISGRPGDVMTVNASVFADKCKSAAEIAAEETNQDRARREEIALLEALERGQITPAEYQQRMAELRASQASPAAPAGGLVSRADVTLGGQGQAKARVPPVRRADIRDLRGGADAHRREHEGGFGPGRSNRPSPAIAAYP